MTIKMKQRDDGTFAIKGLELNHVIVLLQMLNHVQLGYDGLPFAASELIQAFEETATDLGGGIEDFLDGTTLRVMEVDEDSKRHGKCLKEPMIQINFE